jgi:hypothetical protein
MATSRNKPAPKGAKAPRASAQATTEVEVVEESAGFGWETGVAIITTVALILAIVLVESGMAPFGGGLLT